MVRFAFFVLLVAAFASGEHASGEHCSMTISVNYPTEEGQAPSISKCEQTCSTGTELFVVSSTAYKRLPELEAYGFMVKVNYVLGALQGCSLVRTMSDEDMKLQATNEALANCPALQTSKTQLSVTTPTAAPKSTTAASTTTTTTPAPTSTTTTTTPAPTSTTTTTTTLPPIQYCASGFSRLGDSCYLIAADSTSRQDAQTYCQSFGGDLAVISSQAEQDLVTDALDRDVWILPTDQKTLGTFLPNSGYTNWAGNGPSSSEQTSCVSVLQGGEWRNDDCSFSKYALCEKDPERSAPEYSCPSGQTLFRDSCYYVTSAIADYNTGKLSCLHDGARPVFINDQEEQDFVAGLSSETVYIGIDDIATENTFLSNAHGKAIYTNWNSGEPNNVNEEDCVHMFGTTNKWNDVSCAKSYKMICESSAAPLTRCPLGYNKFGDTCLGVSTVKGTVGSGNSQCEAIGGYFAVPESLEEQNFVAGFLQEDTLIASTRVARQTMHDFARLDGIPFAYQGWDPVEPNDYEGEDCVEMRKVYGYLWNDIDCSKVAPYLCRTPGLP